MPSNSLFQASKVIDDSYRIKLKVSKSEGFLNGAATTHQKQGEDQN